MIMLKFLYSTLILSYASSNLISDHYKYILKQGTYSNNGSLYMYSPYILWNTGDYTASEILSTPIGTKGTIS